MKGRVSVDRELCKGCKYCVLSCPKGVLVIDTEFNKSGFYASKVDDPGKCTGCALCAQMCPEIAIEVWVMEDEEEGTLAGSQK